MKRVGLIQQLESVYKVQTNLDVEDSTFIINLLFQYVSEGKIQFELASKKGSVISEFIVSVVGGLFASVLYDFVKKVYDRLRENRKNGKKINPVYIFLSDRQYVLTGEDNDVLPERD